MEGFVKGDIVVVKYPFSNLTGTKRRPALILRKAYGNDYLLCSITTKTVRNSIELKLDDCIETTLKVDSYIRPLKIFTAEDSIIYYKAGAVKDYKINEVVSTIVNALNKD